MSTTLVQEYNELVQQAKAQGLSNYSPVKRFASVAVGQRRLAKLKSALAPSEPVAQALTTQEEPAPVPTQEAPVAKKKRGPALKNGGETIREMTDQFNRKVAGMSKKKRAANKWAKHHTSLFSSLAAAKAQLARLEKAIEAPAAD